MLLAAHCSNAFTHPLSLPITHSLVHLFRPRHYQMSSPTSSAAAAAAAATTATVDPMVIVTKAEIVNIATWILLVTSSLAMLARLSTKWAVSRHLQTDDCLAIVALVRYGFSAARILD
jgi:hypothetical protein